MSIPLYRISQISSVWNALASDNRKYITRIYKERFFIMNWIKKQRKHLRLWVQVLFTALTNGYVIGFTEGKIYRGTSKKLCVPGLNCYSCPGAIGSCPIGSLQAVLGSKNYKFSFYVIGFLMIFGSLMGRFVCGWLCPFGLVQDLLHKIPFVKKIKKVPFDRYLRYLKYVILVVFVIAMPLLLVGESGYGSLGGGLATVSIFLHRPWSLLLIGIVFVLETLSVILQVISFQTTGKRIFKMTPIHHHFEMLGWSEWKVDIVFWIVGLIGSIIYLIIWG